MAILRRTLLKSAAVLGVSIPASRRSSANHLPHTLRVSGGTATSHINYTIEVSGQAELGSEANHEDRVDNGNTIKGIVAGGTDSYRFSGQITSFWSGDDVTVEVNGQQVNNPVGHPRGSGSLPHTIVLEGGPGIDQNNAARYELQVSGRLNATEQNPDDNVSGNYVDGHLWQGHDEYQFSGRIERLNVYEGTANVRIEMR